MISHRYFLGASIAALALCSAPAIAGEVSGVVADQTQTVALRSAVVRIVELGRQVVTASDGSFTIADLPEGSYTIEASYIGVPSVSQTITVPQDGTVKANFALGGEAALTILVIGQAANLANALSREYASDTVVDVVTRDSIGQFPDQNVAESLRRLPGVNVLNDQGEGRFVTVRGLNPNLNSTSVNGVRLPAPESDVRSVALDVVASDVIESIEVKKSLTPDMDGDMIGASIEINTVNAFSRLRDHITLSVEGSYNELSEEISPKAGMDFAVRLGENFGISGGLSYYQRTFETDNIEADGWNDDDGHIYAEDVEYRDYNVERERISASLGLDFRPSDTTLLYARGLFSRFDDQEYRRRTVFGLGDAFITGSGESARFADLDPSKPGDEYAITVERDVKDRFERQEIRTLSVGGETSTGGWHVEYMGSWARSTEAEDDSIDPATFARDFEGDGLVVGFNYADPQRPAYAIGGVKDFYDADEYELDGLELTDISDAQDEEYSARLDIGREFAAGSGTFTVQVGGKGRWREKTYNSDIQILENDDLTLADVLGEQSYRLADIGPVTDFGGVRDYFESNRDDFELEEANSAFKSAVEDFSIEEDIYAAYGLARWDNNSISVIGGVRFEYTQTDIVGNYTQLVAEDGTLPNGSIAGEDTVIVSPQYIPRNFGIWLPSINVRYEPVEDLVLRVAGYRSMVRPNFAQMAPRFRTEQDDENKIEGEFGNPGLRPYKAWNADAGVEYYFASNGTLSASFFYKKVRDYIVDVEYEAEDLNNNDEIDPAERLLFNGIRFDEAVIPINGDSAEIFGVELGFAMQWSMLPAPFDGFITQANYTYTDATALVPDGGSGTIGAAGDLREMMLPKTSKHTINGSLGYDKGPVSLRLAGTWRDLYLDELGGSADEDRIVDSHFQLDASARLRITPNIQVFAEAVNLTDANYFAYNTVGGGQNLYQYENYGRTFKGGVRVNF